MVGNVVLVYARRREVVPSLVVHAKSGLGSDQMRVTVSLSSIKHQTIFHVAQTPFLLSSVLV